MLLVDVMDGYLGNGTWEEFVDPVDLHAEHLSLPFFSHRSWGLKKAGAIEMTHSAGLSVETAPKIHF